MNVYVHSAVCLAAHTRMKSVEFDWCAQSCRQTMWKLVEGDRAAKTAAGCKERGCGISCCGCWGCECVCCAALVYSACCGLPRAHATSRSSSGSGSSQNDWQTDELCTSCQFGLQVASGLAKKCCSLPHTHTHLCYTLVHKVAVLCSSIHWSIAF